jgi:hypothetical protein
MLLIQLEKTYALAKEAKDRKVMADIIRFQAEVEEDYKRDLYVYRQAQRARPRAKSAARSRQTGDLLRSGTRSAH